VQGQTVQETVQGQTFRDAGDGMRDAGYVRGFVSVCVQCEIVVRNRQLMPNPNSS
jgi:hypothetical protein